MSFNKDKHIKYWRMNSNILPDHYIATDASRMTLGFFTVAALDLLGVLESVKEADRQGWIQWIYSCQCQEGGFRGFTGTDLGPSRNQENQCWDPASIPATFFALAALLVLGDDMVKVRREQCLEWLPKLQRVDGSFGEILSENGNIEGGTDLRFCCCAAGIAYILCGNRNWSSKVFDDGALIRYISSCQNYNGGFGESPSREPHSGLTYCAVAALAFVQRLRHKSTVSASELMTSCNGVVRWMLERQTAVLEEVEEEEDGDDDDDDDEDDVGTSEDVARQVLAGVNRGFISHNQDVSTAGFNGRDGKIADTCYCFWNVGALAILDRHHLIDASAMRNYLLDKVQHMIGGFGKGIGAPPDVLHSYLGLAALSLVGEEGVKPLDPTMCMSVEAVARLDRIKWSLHDGNVG